MESAVFFLNSENGRIELLGKIESESEEHALRKLGEFGEPVLVPHPEYPKARIKWSGRFGVGTVPKEIVALNKPTCLFLSAEQKALAVSLGDGNIGDGVYKALWAAGRNLGQIPEERITPVLDQQVVVKLSEADRALARVLGRGKIAHGVRRALSR